MVLGWFLMALILSLDVMGIRDSINFCPVGKKKWRLIFFYFNGITWKYGAKDLEYGFMSAQERICRLSELKSHKQKQEDGAYTWDISKPKHVTVCVQFQLHVFLFPRTRHIQQSQNVWSAWLFSLCNFLHAFLSPPELQAQASSLLFLTVVFCSSTLECPPPFSREFRSTLWVHVADAVITYPTVISPF